MDLFNDTSLNPMSIRSRLVSQPNKKLNSNSEQSFNSTDLSLITFGIILPPNLRDKMTYTAVGSAKYGQLIAK